MQSNIPLVEFTDVNSDGMIDMIFFYNSSIYTYTNLHKPVALKDAEQFLCKSQKSVEIGPIFYDYTKLTPKELADGGNDFVQIQNLQDQFEDW